LDEDVKQVQDESEHTGKPYKKTLAYRWMNWVARVVWFWSLFAAAVFIAQLYLFAFTESAQAIPGSGAIYAGAATISAAFVGGEKIAKKIGGPHAK